MCVCVAAVGTAGAGAGAGAAQPRRLSRPPQGRPRRASPRTRASAATRCASLSLSLSLSLLLLYRSSADGGEQFFDDPRDAAAAGRGGDGESRLGRFAGAQAIGSDAYFERSGSDDAARGRLDSTDIAAFGLKMADQAQQDLGKLRTSVSDAARRATSDLSNIASAFQSRYS